MKLTLASETPELVRVDCSGPFVPEDLPPGSQPLVELLGPDAYGRRILLNLRQTSYIDSGGISLLIGWQKRFRAAGGRLVLYEIPELIRHGLELLNLHRVLTLAADEASAEALARGEQG